jgi:hypothetical protein
MKPQYTAKEISESVRTHPVRWREITRESTLSWPVPVVKDGKLYLSFFFYPAGGPRGNLTLGRPYYRALADPNSIETIEFTPAKPKEFGIERIGARPFARQDEKLLESVTLDECHAMVDRFFHLTDEIIIFYLKPVSDLSQNERDVIIEYYSLFRRLTQKQLWPVYRRVNPEFFKWVETINESTNGQ